MGSATEEGQIDLDSALKERNENFGVHHHEKAKMREHIKLPGIHPSKFFPHSHG
jgi:hypothetical protein